MFYGIFCGHSLSLFSIFELKLEYFLKTTLGTVLISVLVIKQ